MYRTFFSVTSIILIGLAGSSSCILTAYAYSPTPQTVYKGGVQVHQRMNYQERNWWTKTPWKNWEKNWEVPFSTSKKKPHTSKWTRGLLHTPHSSTWSLTPR